MCSNFATRMQEAQLHAEIDLVCSIFVSIPRVRVCRVSTDKGFPCAIAL
jgi:hypothetical protein